MITNGRTRLRHGTWLAASALLTGAAVTACSPAQANSGGTQPTQSAPATTGASSVPASLGDVTLHVGDQAGAGSQALLTAAGLIGKLPFKVDWSDFTAGPPMLQAMSAGAVDIGAVG